MPAMGNVLIGGAGTDDFVFAHVNVGATTRAATHGRLQFRPGRQF